MTTRDNKKRYICSFVKMVNGELKPNVIVIEASNNIIAKAILCEKYGVKNYQIPTENLKDNSEEGIKTIRLSETNVYGGESVNDNFISDDS